MRPVLFQGKYDLNIKIARHLLWMDGTRREYEDREIIAMAMHSKLAIATRSRDPNGGMIIQNVQSSRNGGDWDLEISCLDTRDFVGVYTSIEAVTEAGQKFLDEYLPSCIVEARCRICSNIVVGDEIFDHRCICQACREKNPNCADELDAEEVVES